MTTRTIAAFLVCAIASACMAFCKLVGATDVSWITVLAPVLPWSFLAAIAVGTACLVFLIKHGRQVKYGTLCLECASSLGDRAAYYRTMLRLTGRNVCERCGAVFHVGSAGKP